MTRLEDCCAACSTCGRVVCLDLDEHLDDDGVCEGCGGVFDADGKVGLTSGDSAILWDNESGPEGASTPESPGLTPLQLALHEERSYG